MKPARADEPFQEAQRHGASGARRMYTLLYDGHCRLCTHGTARLIKLARPGAIERISYHEPGVLERFEGVTLEMCDVAMQLVGPDGRVYSGFEAAVRALATRRIVGWIGLFYYIPGVRQGCDAAYRFVAKRRHRLAGRANRTESCDMCDG